MIDGVCGEVLLGLPELLVPVRGSASRRSIHHDVIEIVAGLRNARLHITFNENPSALKSI